MLKNVVYILILLMLTSTIWISWPSWPTENQLSSGNGTETEKVVMLYLLMGLWCGHRQFFPLKMYGFQPESHYAYMEKIFKTRMDSDLHWVTRYSRKPRRDVKLISKSCDESDQKRSRLNSGPILSLSMMTQSSYYTPLSFPIDQNKVAKP